MSGDVLRRKAAAESSLRNPTLLMLDRRSDAPLLIALVKSVFSSQTERVPKPELLERLAAEASALLESSELPAKFLEGYANPSPRDLADALLASLVSPRDQQGGYGWVRIDVDLETREATASLSTEGIRALELLDRLDSDRRAFTMAKAEDLRSQVDDLRYMVTESRDARLAWLRERIAPYLLEIEKLESGGEVPASTSDEVAEKLEHIVGLIAPMSPAVRRVAEAERDAAAGVEASLGRERLRSDLLMVSYVEEFIHRFEKSEDGKSYSRAEKVVCDDYFEEGISAALDDVAASAHANKRVRSLVEEVGSLSIDLQREISGVVAAQLASGRVIERLSRGTATERYLRQQDSLAMLRRCFGEWSTRAKGQNPTLPCPLPYGGTRKSRVIYELGACAPASRPRKVLPPPEQDGSEALARMLRMGAPRTGRTLRLVLENPVMVEGLVDMGASFNLLPPEERLIQEVGGLLSRLGDGGDELDQVWDVTDCDGAPQKRRTARLLFPRVELEQLAERLGE